MRSDGNLRAKATSVWPRGEAARRRRKETVNGNLKRPAGAGCLAAPRTEARGAHNRQRIIGTSEPAPEGARARRFRGRLFPHGEARGRRPVARTQPSRAAGAQTVAGARARALRPFMPKEAREGNQPVGAGCAGAGPEHTGRAGALRPNRLGPPLRRRAGQIKCLAGPPVKSPVRHFALDQNMFRFTAKT